MVLYCIHQSAEIKQLNGNLNVTQKAHEQEGCLENFEYQAKNSRTNLFCIEFYRTNQMFHEDCHLIEHFLTVLWLEVIQKYFFIKPNMSVPPKRVCLKCLSAVPAREAFTGISYHMVQAFPMTNYHCLYKMC